MDAENRLDDEIVTRCAPEWAWQVIDETLELDRGSPAFAPELKQEISEAYEAMIDCCEESLE